MSENVQIVCGNFTRPLGEHLANRGGLLLYLEDFSHLALLWQRAVVLDGQDDRHVGCDERRPVDCFYHVLQGKVTGCNLAIRLNGH